MSASTGALWKCDPGACAATNPIKNQLAQPEGLALDATDVYFSTTGTSQIYRVVR
jgi:hypothetical protein